MKINPTDWVLYRINPLGTPDMLNGKVAVYFEKFSNIPKVYASRIEALIKRYYHYPGIIDYNDSSGTLDVLLVADKNVEKHIPKFDIALNALKRPYTPFLTLMDPIYHLEEPWSRIAYYYRQLSSYHIQDDIKKFKATFLVSLLNLSLCDQSSYVTKLYNEINTNLTNLKKEATQIKTTMFSNQRLIELHEYDIEKRQVLSNREFIHVTNMPASEWYGANKLDLLLRYCHVDSSSKYNVLHDILTFNGKHYVVSSGHMYYTIDRYNIFSINGKKEPIFKLQWDTCRVVTITKSYKNNSKVDLNFLIPGDVLTKRVVAYLNSKYQQQSYKMKDYKDDAKEKAEAIKKPVVPKKPLTKRDKVSALFKERTAKIDIPIKKYNPKQAPSLDKKDTAKACVMEKKTGRIFRGPAARCKTLVDSKQYDYCEERFWKKQQFKYNEKHERVIIKGPAIYDSVSKEYILPIVTNINKSMYGKKLGERQKRRELKAQQVDLFRNMNQHGNMFKTHTQHILYKDKDGIFRNKQIIHSRYTHKLDAVDTEARQKQSKADSFKYTESLKTKPSKNSKRALKAMEWEAILVSGPKNKVYGKAYIKAFTEKEAEDKLKLLINLKKHKVDELSGKITDNIKPWNKRSKQHRDKKQVILIS